MATLPLLAPGHTFWLAVERGHVGQSQSQQAFGVGDDVDLDDQVVPHRDPQQRERSAVRGGE